MLHLKLHRHHRKNIFDTPVGNVVPDISESYIFVTSNIFVVRKYLVNQSLGDMLGGRESGHD